MWDAFVVWLRMQAQVTWPAALNQEQQGAEGDARVPPKQPDTSGALARAQKRQRTASPFGEARRPADEHRNLSRTFFTMNFTPDLKASRVSHHSSLALRCIPER